MANDQNQPSPLDSDLEAEIAAALGDQSLEDMMSDAAPPPVKKEPAKRQAAPQSGGKRGRHRDEPEPDRSRTGTVVAIHKNEVIVEFGAKEQGICPVTHFKEPPKPGDRIEFMVDSEIEEGLFQLSVRGETVKVNWDAVQRDMIVEATVTGSNKGGLTLTVAHHEAFMPISQIDTRRVEDLTPYVGVKMRCQVVELDKERGRVVLSRRNVLVTEQAEAKVKLLQELQVGDMVDGVVRRIEKFGAFVEIVPGVDGLLHIGDMSWQRIEDPNTVVKVDQPVRVQVLKVEADTGRIGLGLKQAGADPWEVAENKYMVGSNHIGRVTRTAAFGAFVELEPGIEGLVHIGQLSDKRVDRADQVVKVGETVTVKVMDIDPIKRRVGLSIKALKQDETGEQPSEDDLKRYIRKDAPGKANQTRAMASLMSKFGGEGGLKGGI